MDFLHQIKLSFSFYWRAFRFIETNNIWRLLVLPAVINLIIAFLITVFAIKTSGVIVEFVLANLKITNADKEVNSFI